MNGTGVKRVCPGEVHEAIKRDDSRWFACTLVGYQGDVELRNCECGSTMGRRPRSEGR